MFGFLLGLLARPIGRLVAGGVIAAHAYWLLSPRAEEPLGFALRTWATDAAAQFAREMPDRPQAATVAVLPLVNDSNGLLAGRVSEAIARDGRYRHLDESLLSSLLKELRGGDVPPATLDEAVNAVRRIGADLAVFGTVTGAGGSLEAPGELQFRLDLRLVERETGHAVFVRRYEAPAAPPPTSLGHWRARIADASKSARVGLWVLVAFLLPMLTAGLIRRVTAEESNAWNAGLLVGYSGVGLVLAWALTGFWVPSWWTMAVLLAAGVLQGLWAFRCATLVDEWRR